MNKDVSFPIAKLLKDKGFKELVNNYFGDNGREEHSRPNYKANYNSSVSAGLTHSRPSIADVVMWIYEKHGLWIYVRNFETLNFCAYILKNGESEHSITNGFKSPTEAYEAAFQHILTNII